MAHKTLLGGTAYTVAGGRDLIDGTGYAKKQGKSLADGTEKTISFAPKVVQHKITFGVLQMYGGVYINGTEQSPNTTVYVEDGTTLVIKLMYSYNSDLPEQSPGSATVKIDGSTVFSQKGNGTYNFTPKSDATITAKAGKVSVGGHTVSYADRVTITTT